MPPLPLSRRLGRAVWHRREHIAVPVLMAAVAVWLFRSVFTGGWVGRDSIEVLWPNLAFAAESFRLGEWPLWNPYDRGGYAFAADPQTALYYPVTWLFALAGARGVTPAATVQAMIILHLAIAGITLHAWLRSRRLPVVAAAAGGVLLMTSVPWLLHTPQLLAWPLAWAPLVWLATDRVVERAGEPGWWRRAAGLGGALGLAAAAGSPPGFLQVVLAGLVYGAFRLGVVLAARRERLGREVVLQLRGVALAAVVTFAATMVIVLPALALMEDSVRWAALRGFFGLGGARGALDPALPAAGALAGLLSPSVGLVNLYLGAATLALVAVGVVARPRRDGGVPVVFVLLAALAAVLAVGGATPVLPWLVAHVPGFGLFREPDRYVALAALAAAVVAAHGVAALVEADGPARRRAAIVLAVAVVALAGGLAALGVRAPASYVALAAGGALLAGAAFVPGRFRALAVGAAVLVVLADVAWFSGPLAALRESPVDDEEDRRWVADLEGAARGDFRVWDEFLMEQRAGSRLAVRELRGAPFGDPLEDRRVAQLRENVLADPQILGAYNVRWVFHHPHHALGRTKNRLPQAPDNMRRKSFERVDAHRFELLGAAPMVLWYGSVLVAPQQRALAFVTMQEHSPGSRVLAVVEKEGLPAAASEAIARVSTGDKVREPVKPVAGTVEEYGRRRVRVRVDAPDEGLVVLNEVHAPGWSVRVDGQPATAVRANYLLRGVMVPAGAHDIVWTYDPPADYFAWLALWGAAVCFVLAAGVGGLRAQEEEREAGEREQDHEQPDDGRQRR